MSDIPEGLRQVKYIVAVASGKGGVGKSTTAVNIALALQAEGYKAGLQDADIYGPSLPLMLGAKEGARPEVRDGSTFIPLEAHGIKNMSLGYLLTDNTPAVWRGPMASGALIQMLTQTDWGELDCLVVDMPPGTGDIQLTLSQKVPVSGVVIVTTPQDIALLDAKKGVEMFRKVNIPVIGIVENMALHICSNCGQSEHIFGEGGGGRIAADYDTDLLGSLPLERAIREQMDSGNPSVVADVESPVALIYRDIANKIMQALDNQNDNSGPEITFE
jgi:ATP-binding protein involved in chromosome partitioning